MATAVDTAMISKLLQKEKIRKIKRSKGNQYRRMGDIKETDRAQDNRAGKAINTLTSGLVPILLLLLLLFYFYFLMLERALRRHWDFRANPRCCGGEE